MPTRPEETRRIVALMAQSIREELDEHDGEAILTDLAAWARAHGGDITDRRAREIGRLVWVDHPDMHAEWTAVRLERMRRLRAAVAKIPYGTRDGTYARMMDAIGERFGVDIQTLCTARQQANGIRVPKVKLSEQVVADWVRANMAVGEVRWLDELAPVIGWTPNNVAARVPERCRQGWWAGLLEVGKFRKSARGGKPRWCMRRVG